MQKSRKDRQLTIIAGLVALMIMGCQQSDEFDQAIAKHRNTLVDQVNVAADGLPFFTIKTLNPVWQMNTNTPIVTIPQFKLTDQNGQARDNSMFAGKVSIVGFFFASCHGVCPFLIEGMKRVERELSALGKKTQFVGFTVNPEVDTPKRLKAYAIERKIDTGSWVLLTGDKDTIYSLAKNTFASQAFQRNADPASFVHSEHLYVIDDKLRLRGILNGTRIEIQKEAKTIVTQLGDRLEKAM